MRRYRITVDIDVLAEDDDDAFNKATDVLTDGVANLPDDVSVAVHDPTPIGYTIKHHPPGRTRS